MIRTRRLHQMSPEILKLCDRHITVREHMQKFVMNEMDYATALEKCVLSLAQNNEELMDRLDEKHIEMLKEYKA